MIQKNSTKRLQSRLHTLHMFINYYRQVLTQNLFLAGNMDLESSKSKQFVASKGSLQEEKMVRALVVDDDSLVRKIHMKLLRKLELQTEAVENGKEAVDLCQSGKSFDLVLMDMEMPIMDGPTVINNSYERLEIYLDYMLN